jgi:hypothetical protein
MDFYLSTYKALFLVILIDMMHAHDYDRLSKNVNNLKEKSQGRFSGVFRGGAVRCATLLITTGKEKEN